MKLHHSLRYWVHALSLVMAQTVAAQSLPSSGSQLLQIPSPPQSKSPSLDLKLPPAESAQMPASESERILVKKIALEGVQSIGQSELLKASGFSPDTLHSVDELRGIAERITDHYRGLGYFLARAYLPAQDITNGTVRFQIVEGRYGRIQLQSNARLADAIAWSMLADLKSANSVNEADLERSLLLLSDLPGLQAKSALTPGAALGTTDLLVDVVPGPLVSGSLDADNHGGRYTGQNRVGARLSLNAPLGVGDQATAHVLTSGDGMSYQRLSYQLNWSGIAAGAAHTALKYRLGAEFTSLEASGTAHVSSVFFNYALKRSRLSNLSAQLSLDQKAFSDQLGGGLLISDKSVEGASLTLKGDLRDSLGLRKSNFSVTWTHGALALLDPAALESDSTLAQTRGVYNKLAFALSSQQSLTQATSLSVGLSGQWASKNLDASEKFALGGANAVRAYPSGEASGDEGLLLVLESRTTLRQFSAALGGQLQFLGFFDVGWISANKRAWESGSKANERTVSGAGLGMHFATSKNWTVSAYAAMKLQASAATSAPDLPVRFWLQTSKLY